MRVSANPNLQTQPLLSLKQAQVGGEFQIHSLEGDARDRLRHLGFSEKQKVRKISGGRNLICSIHGARLALSSELAEFVKVCPLLPS
jgi:Fe2+ transport system protein FeoA